MRKGDEFNAFSPAVVLLEALSRRQISAAELLEGYLSRLDRYDGPLNSVIARDLDRARRDAKEADRRRAAGDRAPLLGLPLTIKESIDVEGFASTAGVKTRVGHRASRDATTVARLRAAGAVVVGKTNVCTWLADFQADNPVYGRTNSPFDLSRTPGGSSGGSATLAAALTALDLGSDLGGSIRVPAAFCGLWGHKPSAGIIPNTGHFPGSDHANPALPMAVQGLHARSAFDLELGLDILSGPEPIEATGWKLQPRPARHGHLRSFRVAVLPEQDWLPVDSEILEALAQLCDRLRAIGATVTETAPPHLGDLCEHYRTFRRMMAATVSLGWPGDFRQKMAEAKLAHGDSFHAADAQGYRATAVELTQWLGQREIYRAAWCGFFKDFDILLTPMTLTPPFTHMTGTTFERQLEIGGRRVEFDNMSFYPSLATLGGLPAVAFPAGRTAAGLPLGLQAIGPLYEDRTPLRFAALLEQAFGGFLPPGGYDAHFS